MRVWLYIKVSSGQRISKFIKFVWRDTLMQRTIGNIILLGTSHIAQESASQIERITKEKRPGIVAVELDPMRFSALMQPKGRRSYLSIAAIRRIGVQGFLFALIGGFVQQQLAKRVGVVPGLDMKIAIDAAKKHGLPIALIDQDIRMTLSRLSKAVTWSERWHFVVDIFCAIFFAKQEMKRLGLDTLDLRRVPAEDLIERLTGELARRYPNVYRVLVEERNEVMAQKLVRIAQADEEKTILAVVGAGHIKGMAAIIKGLRNTHEMVDSG